MTEHAESLISYVTAHSQKNQAEAVAFLDEFLDSNWQEKDIQPVSTEIIVTEK